jgi:hypothetical protein
MKRNLWEIWESAGNILPWMMQGPNAVLSFRSIDEAEKFRDRTKEYREKALTQVSRD